MEDAGETLPAGQTTAQRSAAKHAARQATRPRDPLAAFASDEPTFAQQADGFKDHDALQYWLAEQRKAGGYAKNTLADFAVDMFVAPTSTVDVERIFSQGRLTVSHLQHRFAPQKIADMVNVAADTRHGLLKPGTLLRHMQAQDRDVKKRSGATRSGIDQMLKEQGAQVKDKGKKRKRSPSVDSMVVDSTEEESEPDVVISAHRPRAPRASGQQRQRVAAVSAGPSTSRTRASTSPPFDPTILFYNLEGDEHPIPAGAPAA